MITVNSLSGGQTSSYLAAKFPADYDIFSLVRTNKSSCKYPDKKVRQYVSDRIGDEFIGTLEDDLIITTMLDLEQFIGRRITWVTGKEFDKIIERGSKKYLPNVTQRFCTTELKIEPIFYWWLSNINEPVEVRIGYRANETNRATKMLNKTNKNGFSEFKHIVGKHKNGNNKWKKTEWQKPVFPLITDQPTWKDQIQKFWKGKNVSFAEFNNCIGCFHRDPILLKYQSEKHPNKFQWFIDAEKDTGYNVRTFKNGMTYEQIKNHRLQLQLTSNDFNDCDTGYCGL